MAEWFYESGGERVGPISGSQLKQLAKDGAISQDSLVWTEGAADWVPARKVKGLFAAPVPVAAVATAEPPNGSEPTHLAAVAPTGTLQYASTGLIDGSVAPAPFAPPPPDDGPFHLVGRNFRVGKQQWMGKAVASPRAIYLWKVTRPNRGGFAVGGLIGMAIAAAAARSDDLTRSCEITELPDAVRRYLDPKLKKTKGDIVILNRDALSLVKTTGWGNLIVPSIAAETFPITCGMFGRKKAKEFLRTHGWTLDLTVQPTIAPTHGKAYGLDEETVQERKRKAMWQRVGMLAVGIAVFVIIVLVQIMAAQHR